MRKLLAVLALVAVAACAGPQPNPTVSTAALQQKVLLAEITWEGAQTVILAYKARPTCTVPRTVVTCKSEAAMAELRKINRAAVAGLETAMNLASTPGVTEDKVTAAIAVATTGVAGVNKIIAAYEK